MYEEDYREDDLDRALSYDSFDDEDYDEIEDLDVCPECGSPNTYRDENDFLVCKSCGYKEVPEEDMGECSHCGTPTPESMLIHGLCPVCADDMGL